MEKVRNLLIVYTFGSFVYSLIEIFSRGFTHWTMIISGGAVFVIIYLLSTKIGSSYYSLQIITYALLITASEFIIGLFLNKLLKMNIWDYSSKPHNILGQICLFNSLLWVLLAFPCTFACKFFRKMFKN